MVTLPLTLIGDNLGQRHRYLNAQVDLAAAAAQGCFEDIETLSEQTAVDRLFKIDVANRLKNVEYILKNLRDDDMLYVTRALRCKWLVERRDIINPHYLEDVLFPQMVMPAITKMKHWLYTNLTHPLTSKEFYLYYKSKNIDFAVKFLTHCEIEFLLNEFPQILIQLTPHYLKVLGEKCPKLIKIYFESLETNNELIQGYLEHEAAFYNSIKCLLKSDPDKYLNIIETYHNLSTFDRLSPLATKHILRFHKNRFMAKSELYVVYLLHAPTVAQHLSAEECQELLMKLARADYLNWWFSYANVEPLVKRIERNSRSAFKKRVFVEKDVGERVNEWPYTLPSSPSIVDTNCDKLHVFDDLDFKPIKSSLKCVKIQKRVIKKKKVLASKYATVSDCSSKSDLQKLFDEFRFVGFDGTLYELKGQLGAATSADRRRDILLVLVSKSGGRAEYVESLLRLALRLQNEPVHERAAIVRSLVKRARAWCLPHDVWNMMLEYARGLGLDGTRTEAQCSEGLHAIVIRQLLTSGECESAVRSDFLDDFSTLEEYKLTPSERLKIAIGLQRILISAAADANPMAAAAHLNKLLDVLESCRLPFKTVVSAVKKLAERDLEIAKSLLMRLYNARVGRRELIRQYLELRPDDDAYLNAIRHDPYVLNCEWLIKLLIDGTHANQFFSKLSVYFNETNGIADQFRHALFKKLAVEPDVNLARPLALLAGRDIQSLLNEQDLADSSRFKLAAAIKANMHYARPAPDVLTLDWCMFGMKAVATRLIRSRHVQVKQTIYKMLKERDRRYIRLVMALAQNTDYVTDIFSLAADIRPLAVLRAGLIYYRCLGKAGDSCIWDLVKSFMLNVDLTMRKGLSYILKKADWVPDTLKTEYCTYLYLTLDKSSDRNEILQILMKCLPEINEILLKKILLRVLENLDSEIPEFYPAIIIRYLMLSKSNNELNTRFKEVGKIYLDKMFAYTCGSDNVLRHHFFEKNFHQILIALVYNSAFFDMKYECCSETIETILTWMSFLPKENHFDKYVQIHVTILYYRAIRQCIKQKPELFADHAKKLSEGVDIVGFTFGRYVVKEISELKSKYFDSAIELYREPFTNFLTEYFVGCDSRRRFISAVTKGILSWSEGSAARLGIHVLNTCLCDSEETVLIKSLIHENKNKEVQMFACAEIFN